MPTTNAKKIEIENINHPGKTERVDAAKYEAMKRAFLRTLPKKAPGFNATEILDRIKPHLPEDLFPRGATAGWWAKAVQLDLEAKDIIAREKCSPLRWHKR